MNPRLVVTKLIQQKKALFIGSRTISEAIRMARYATSAQHKRTDPAPIIDYFAELFGAMEVPPADGPIEEAIPEHDHHVVREAITANAAILTSDAKLWLACRSVGRAAVWPLQALRYMDGMSLALTVFGERPERNAGSIFARAAPSGWGGMANSGEHTIVDFSGRLRLYYSTATGEWVAEVPELGTLRSAMESHPNLMHTIAVSWDSDYLRLRVGGVQHPSEINTGTSLAHGLVDAFSVGHRMDLTAAWSGAINVCVMNDRPIGSKVWPILRDSDELTPNPYDDDRLWEAINRQLT